METNKNQKPASDRIRFALWRASRKAGCPTDYRGMELTQQEAVELLEKFNEQTGYNNGNTYRHSNKYLNEQDKKRMYRNQFIEFFKEKYLKRAVSILTSVLKQESEVYEADIFGNPVSNKRYKFYGSGCACGWLTFRKCEKYKMIYSEATSAFSHECLDLFIAQIDPQIVKQLERDGAPIGAIYTQDYQFRQLENECVSAFLKKNGAKEVKFHLHYD